MFFFACPPQSTPITPPQELKNARHLSHHVDTQTGIVMVVPRVPLEPALESYFRLKGKISPLAGPPVAWHTNAGQRIVTYYFKEGCMKDRDEIACAAAVSGQFVRPYLDEPAICKSTCKVPLPEFLCHGTGPKEGTCFIHGILIISGRGRRCGLG